MSKTISNSSSSGVVLGGGDNPVLVTKAGTIAASSGDAIFGAGGGTNTWTIDNSGAISSTDAAGSGIHLGQYGGLQRVVPGVVTNETSGVISGGAYGVYIFGDASVTNASGGSISGDIAIYLEGNIDTVANAGAVNGTSSGVKVSAGGLVSNQSTGVIRGATRDGVYFGPAGLGTVMNDGVIYGLRHGVDEVAGGSVINQSTGVMTGNTKAGVRISGGAGTVVNYGAISGKNYGAYELAGGSVTNQIAATISSTSGSAVQQAGGGTILNFGTLTGQIAGVDGTGGGSVTNQSGGTITGGQFGVEQTGEGTVINAGTMSGSFYSVFEADGGSVTNVAGGVMTSAVYIQGGIGTVVNAGTIAGAVTFRTQNTKNLLRVDPGAVLTGNIAGGTGVVELGSAAGAGTLAGFDGTSISNFGSLVFDTGAKWTIAGNSAASGLGTIAIDGFTIGDTIDLTGFVAVTKTFTADTLVLNDAGAVNSATLHIAGKFKTSNFVTTDDTKGGTDISFTIPSYHTISGTYTSGITLTDQADNPVSVLSSGTIDVAAGTALYGTGGGSNSWTIDNAGLISGGSGSGITLGKPGTTVSSGLVTNDGSIAAGVGVHIYGPGAVSNASSGHITGSLGGGIIITAGGGTVFNSGSLTGGFIGVEELAGGNVTNQSGGVITATYGYNVRITGGLGTIANFGIIIGNNGVDEDAGGLVSNALSATISAAFGAGVVAYNAPVTVVNAGAIRGGSYGVHVNGGGLVSNVSTGTITSSAYGVLSVVVPATIINAGLVQGALFGVVNKGPAGGALTNSGTITGATDAVYYQNAGSVTNLAGGTISSAGLALKFAGAGTISNAGTMISAGATAVSVLKGTTLTNSGAIDANSASGNAVMFVGGKAGTSQLIVDPGATFLGTVVGDGLLDLASGASTGTLSGLGVAFTNFGSLQFDTGAHWLVSGSTATGAGKLGTIPIVGFTVGDTIDLTGFVAVTETFTANTLVLKDAGAVNSTTLHITGAFNTANFVTTGANGGTGTDITFVPSYHIISGTYSSGITLTNQADNPVSVLSTGTIAATSSSALYGQGGGSNSWTIGNAGLINANGSSGIALGNAGNSVSSGLITNAGTISGNVGVYIDGPGSVANQSNGTITASSLGVQIKGGSGTVVNEGSVAGSYGVYEGQGGSVINAFGGQITATNGGVRILGGLGTVINDGAIKGTNTGVYQKSGGTVTNQSDGTIGNGLVGVVQAGSGIIVNLGSISGSIYSIFDRAGGSVTNIAGGIISGGAVKIEGGAGTVVNAGTMAALTFAETSAENLLIVDPGAVFNGNIAGGTGVLELASAATAGVLTGFDGVAISNFSSLEFDAGASWTISGDSTGLGAIGTIGGFDAGDTIDLTGFVAVTETFATDVLTLTDAGKNTATLNIHGNFTSADFHIAADKAATGTNVTVDTPCYAAGTRIATTKGEVAVEHLREGDLVLTVSGRTQPIRWIGHRRVDIRQHPDPRRIRPVRIAAHAFGPAMPKRDLLLSPDHAVFIEDVLIPIRYLVNGSSVAPVERDTVTYYHIELPQHDVLLAEGMPAESYLEAGARSAFANFDGVLQLHPDFAPPHDHCAMLWETDGYAPLVVVGEAIDRAHLTLARQAACIGARRPTSMSVDDAAA